MQILYIKKYQLTIQNNNAENCYVKEGIGEFMCVSHRQYNGNNKYNNTHTYTPYNPGGQITPKRYTSYDIVFSIFYYMKFEKKNYSRSSLFAD